MKKVCAILLTVIFVTIILPLVIVFVMEHTIDNDSQGSTEIIEENAEQGS